MSNSLVPLTPAQSRKLKGRTLSRIDREHKMLTSGPLGIDRLILNIALDFMEMYPNMTQAEAVFAAKAYCARTFN